MPSPLRLENYPEWYVENCPPADALNVEGTIYRFVESFPTIANDFLSYHEMGQRPNGKRCERCGLSVFHSIDDIRNSLRHLLKAYPGKQYGDKIVRRELSVSDGKTKKTGKIGHHTWWAYEGVTRHELFELVEQLPNH